MTARLTAKLRLALAVSLLAVAAHAAGAASVSRVNDGELDARELRLVRDEGAELQEGPSRHLRPLAPPEPSPAADMRQFLQRYPASGVCSESHELFADDVINVAPEIGLAPARPPEGASNGLRASALRLPSGGGVLQSLAAHVVTLTHGLNFLTPESPAVRSGRKVGDSKVNADEVRVRDRHLFWNVRRDEQKPATVFPQDEVRLAFGEGKAFALILAHDEGHDDSLLKGEQVNAVNALERHD